MPFTEHRRNQLHNRAHEVLGVEEGDALGTDLRHEIALTETRLRAEMAQHQEQTHKDFGQVYKAMSRMMWTMTISMIGTVVASAGFAFTAGWPSRSNPRH